MNKALIKIIKRENAAKTANSEIQDKSEQKTAAAISEKKIECHLNRKMANTISNWIADRRKSRRTEERSAVRMMFGSEPFFGKTV